MNDLEAIRIAVFAVGWPGMAFVSGYVLASAFRFHAKVHGSAVGRLVLLMVIGWTVTMSFLAFIATLYLQANPVAAGPSTAAFLVFWAGSMALMVWLVHRWGDEAISINHYYAELAATDRIRTQLLNTIAHELNTPLMPLLLQFDVLRQELAGAATPPQVDRMASIQRNLDRLQALVDQVVLSTRVQTGNLRVVPTTVKLGPWLSGAIRRFEAEAKATSRPLRVECDADADVDVDREAMHRVVGSLLDNAFRFSAPEAAVAVSARAVNGNLILAVRDEGCGFTAEQREHLFQPLRTAHDPMQQTRTGAGLSLYVAKALVEGHGGQVDASSAGAGQGATFTVEIPLRSALHAGGGATV